MDQQSAQDARTAPVAVWNILEKMTPEQKVVWRIADVTGNPASKERGTEDLPFPYGWYAVCYSDELAVGQVKPMRYFARELVAWRGVDGQARVLDAYCKHLGAHMGHGGKVNGNLLECPFHAWRYDGTGSVKEIPYARIIPPQAKRSCGNWHVAEANGFVWVWYHPEGIEPMWEVERFPETESADWAPYERYEWHVASALQFIAENTADLAHFKYVHGTATYPTAKMVFNGHLRNGLVEAKMGTPRGEVDGKIVNDSFGPGQSSVRFSGISETLLVAAITPVEKDLLHSRFAFTQPKAQMSGPMAGVAKALIKDIVKQFDQDKIIWDRQRFVERALVCDGDGPIGDFRRWYYQFYAEWKGGNKPLTAEG